MNSTQIIAVCVIAVLAVGGVSAVVVMNNNNSSKDSTNNTTDLTWEQIVDDAKGQTITMGFYTSDPMVAVWYEDFVTYMKDTYDITVTAKSYGPAAASTAVAEMEEGLTTGGTFDLIWGDTSAYAAMKNSKGDYSYVYSEAWASKLPNSYYLKSSSEQMISGMYPEYISGTAVNFSNGQTMLVYNQDFNTMTAEISDGVTVDVPYDCVVLLDGEGTVTGFVKVSADGDDYAAQEFTATDADDFAEKYAAADAVGIDSLRAAVKTAHGDTVKGYLLYGLPSDFAELAEWVVIYDKQFGYPAPTNGSAVFHTNLLTQAMIYELTYADAGNKTGWKVADDKAANVTAVNEALKDVTDVASYKAAFGYVFEYLEELDPYVHQWSAGSTYQDTGTIVAFNAKIVGNQTTDTDYSDDTVMIAMSTVTSIDSRVGDGKQYSYNAGAFTLDTGCSSDYYIFIPDNSSHKTAAMVAINQLLDPSEQIKWFSVTGNGFNIDTSKKVIGKETTVYDEYFSETLSGMSMYLSPSRLAEVTEVAMLTGYVSYFTENWAALEPEW